MVLRRLRRMGTLQEQVQPSRQAEDWDRGELEELGEAVMLVCPRPVMLPAAYFPYRAQYLHRLHSNRLGHTFPGGTPQSSRRPSHRSLHLCVSRS